MDRDINASGDKPSIVPLRNPATKIGTMTGVTLMHDKTEPKPIRFLPCLILLFAAAVSDAGEHQRLRIDIDLQRTETREASEILRTHVVAYEFEQIPKPVWNSFFEKQRVGDVLFDTSGLSKESHDLSDLKRRMRSLGPLVQQIVRAGGRVQLVFQNGIPRWLSSDPNNTGDLFQGGLSEGQKIWHSVPPSDFDEWARVAYAFVDYFNNELGTDGQVYYVVGSEPDSYWVGNEDDWHRYYDYFVRGARKADPDVIIGGINSVGIHTRSFTKYNPIRRGGNIEFEGLRARGEHGMVYNWLEYAAHHGLPIDIVAWHDYPAPSPIPGETANWVAAERQLDAWLNEFGFGSAEFLLNDWPEWKPVEHENDGEFQAAYVTSSLITMLEHTRVKPLYLGLIDLGAYTSSAEKRRNASFGGGNGMFTSLGLAKPVFNAYSLMSRMKGRLVTVENRDEFIRVLTTVDRDNVYVLLTNFIPSKRIVANNTYGVDPGEFDEEDRAAIRQLVRGSGHSREKLLESLIDGSRDINSLDLPPAAKRRLHGMRQVYLDARARAEGAASVELRLSGLPSGSQREWRYSEYVIDKARANSYAVRDRISAKAQADGITKDRARLHDFVALVNERTGIESGRLEERTPEFGNGTVQIKTALEPNSVHLLMLRRD